MISEKRRYPRYLFTVAVTLNINGNLIRGFECTNISQGGMFIAIEENLEIGTEGTVTFTAKYGSEFLTIEALFRVVRSCYWGNSPQEKGIGIEFIGMDGMSVQNLYKILGAF